MAIKLFTTGGTIDDLEYNSELDAPKLSHSIVPKMINVANLNLSIIIEAICFKDSRFINDDDRQKLAKKINSSTENQILISHGTLTMIETAKFLSEFNFHKTIVLFGAMIPSNKSDTDAYVNLGFALATVQHFPVGVYIAMHGNVFNWDNVKKNEVKGRFEMLNKS